MDMEPSPQSTEPLAFKPPTRSSDVVLKLSPIWQLLPVELVHQILDHLIQHLLTTCCKASNIYSDTTDPVILEDVWFNFRRDNLFKSQKPLIERHFHDHWLNCVDIWIYIRARAGHNRFEACFRYQHASHDHENLKSSGGNDDMLPDPQLTRSDDGDPESEKVTFFLAGPNTTPRASLIDIWDQVIKAMETGDDCFRLGIQVALPEWDGVLTDSTRRRLEDWDVLDDGHRIRFPWKKVMTMVLTYILELWRREDRFERSMADVGMLEVWFIP
ncbi:hypothetical protein QBC45DRAFT_396357 [Copromyces sp. CBS 386.78]|nr:hypothetical protein QBC45DRAFT_396357 [Copromyces sp. CBS 386.78]